MKQAGADVGLDFTGKADRYPNTLQAHVLLEYAKTLPGNVQDTLAEILFQVSHGHGHANDTISYITQGRQL